MSKEDLEGQTSGIFVFWLFVEFWVVHALGGCIRMITDDGPPCPPNLAMTPPTRVTKGRTLPTVSSAALVDQLIRCCPRSHRSCTMYIFSKVRWLSNSHKVHHRATILWFLPALIFEVHRSDSVKFRIENHVENCCILPWPPCCPLSSPPSPPHCHLYFSCHMIFPASADADSENSLNVSVGASRRQLGR